MSESMNVGGEEFPEWQLVKARKRYRCQKCNESIEVGVEYARYHAPPWVFRAGAADQDDNWVLLTILCEGCAREVILGAYTEVTP